MNYPYVRYPVALSKILIEDFELPEINALPIKPVFTSPRVTGIPYIWGSVMIFIIAAVSNSIMLFAVSAFLMLFTSLFVIFEKAKVKSAEESFNEVYNQYKKAVELYHSKVQLRKSFVENLKNVDWKNSYKNKLIKEIFLKSTKPELVCLTTKGVAEGFFYSYLIKHFSGLQIITNLTIKQHQQNLMVPDFIIFDKTNNIYIDIEIDEPYTFNSREPIHYYEQDKEAHIDEYRNYFFTSNNWVVIRFAEEQITDYPDQCCYFISATLNHLTNQIQDISPNIENEQLKQITCWTKEISLIMEKFNYREDYLNATNDFDIKKKINPNKFTSMSFNMTKRKQSYKNLMAIYYAKNAADEV